MEGGGTRGYADAHPANPTIRPVTPNGFPGTSSIAGRYTVII